jgi:hypothetical protein
MKIIKLLALLLSLFYIYLFLSPSLKSKYNHPLDNLSEASKNDDLGTLSLIRAINNANSRVKSLYYTDIKIQLSQNIAIRAKGKLFFQKDKFLRIFINHSLFGQEMDIGSNKDFFWFWSKRMTPAALFYAHHKDLDKTMLKTPLNPDWLLESFGITQLPEKNIEFVKCGFFQGIIQYKVSALGENVFIVTLLDPKINAIAGKYLYREDGNLLAGVEFKSFKKCDKIGAIIPTSLRITWPEENIYMDWDMSGVGVNQCIDPNNWELPYYKQTINMAEN